MRIKSVVFFLVSALLSFLSVTCCYQLSRIVFYGHRLASLYTGYLLLCLCWSLLRCVYYGFGVSPFWTVRGGLFMYWLPLDLELASYSLIVVYCSFRLLEASHSTVQSVTSPVLRSVPQLIHVSAASKPRGAANRSANTLHTNESPSVLFCTCLPLSRFCVIFCYLTANIVMILISIALIVFYCGIPSPSKHHSDNAVVDVISDGNGSAQHFQPIAFLTNISTTALSTFLSMKWSSLSLPLSLAWLSPNRVANAKADDVSNENLNEKDSFHFDSIYDSTKRSTATMAALSDDLFLPKSGDKSHHEKQAYQTLYLLYACAYIVLMLFYFVLVRRLWAVSSSKKRLAMARSPLLQSVEANVTLSYIRQPPDRASAIDYYASSDQLVSRSSLTVPSIRHSLSAPMSADTGGRGAVLRSRFPEETVSHEKDKKTDVAQKRTKIKSAFGRVPSIEEGGGDGKGILALPYADLDKSDSDVELVTAAADKRHSGNGNGAVVVKVSDESIEDENIDDEFKTPSPRQSPQPPSAYGYVSPYSGAYVMKKSISDSSNENVNLVGASPRRRAGGGRWLFGFGGGGVTALTRPRFVAATYLLFFSRAVYYGAMYNHTLRRKVKPQSDNGSSLIFLTCFVLWEFLPAFAILLLFGHIPKTHLRCPIAHTNPCCSCLVAIFCLRRFFEMNDSLYSRRGLDTFDSIDRNESPRVGSGVEADDSDYHSDVHDETALLPDYCDMPMLPPYMTGSPGDSVLEKMLQKRKTTEDTEDSSFLPPLSRASSHDGSISVVRDSAFMGAMGGMPMGAPMLGGVRSPHRIYAPVQSADCVLNTY